MKLFKNITFPLIAAVIILAVVYYLYVQDQPLLENFESSGLSIGVILVIVVLVIVVLAVGIAIYRNPRGSRANIFDPKPSTLSPSRASQSRGVPPESGTVGGKRGDKRRASH